MSDLDKTSILVVDDNVENRYAISRYLKRAGFHVWEAGTGQEALRLSLSKPSLIILDVNLPDIRGFDVCQKIKSNPLTASVPVLHTSASFVKLNDKVHGLEFADGYLTAPVEPKELIATVRTLIRTKEAESKAQALADQWQVTFDSISDGICLLDDEARIERSNIAFTEIFGHPPQEFIGRSFLALTREHGINVIAYERMREFRKREVTEILCGQRWLRITLDPVVRSETYHGAVCVVADITDRKKTEDEIRQLNFELEKRVMERTARLEESVQALESFCYMIAHDLRAPLRAMQGFTTALIEDYGAALDATGRDYTERIGLAATRIDRLIRDLLAYGKISHSELPITTVDVGEIVARVLIQLADEIEAKCAVIEVKRPLPTIQSNITLVEQIIVNLLTNALKFVAPGTPPRIEIWSDQADHSMRFFVKDNGIGIDPAHQKRIFGTFERLHGLETYPGTGIGLAIVAKGVERMGGRVEVDSDLGRGSTFWFEVPERVPHT